MIKLDENKLKKLNTSYQRLEKKYGREESPERELFEAKAKAFYFTELLKKQRKQQKMTQQQLANKIGKKREFISNIERGNSDMQLSTFMLISNALGLRVSLVLG